MSDVSFDEEPQYERRAEAATQDPTQGSIIRLMYKLGVAKTEKDANVVMGGIIVVCMLISATMLVFVQPHANPADQAKIDRDNATIERVNAAASASQSHQ